MIEVTHLTKKYGPNWAVKDINFTVKKGEVVGFLGPNGAGKTTTMKIITGFMAPTEGVAKVGGLDVFEDPIAVKRMIGYLPETPPLYVDMRVADFLNYVGQLKGLKKAEIKLGVEKALEKTNLTEVRNRMIGNLSKGFRQRVGIAQALVHDPAVLILDEPTVGLDPKQVLEIRNLIKDLSGNRTVILSTHILPEVEATCERIIIINKGQIVAEDTIQGLSRRMSDSRKILVRVRREGSLEKNIGALKGVKSIRPLKDGQHTYEVELEKSEESCELLAEAVVKSGAGLVELRPLEASLEDIFLKLTTTDVRGA